MVTRRVEPSGGRIHLGDEDVTDQDADRLRRRIGYVIQAGGLFPHMTVGTNTGLVPRMLGWGAERTAQRVDELPELVGLDPAVYRDRYPREPAGGRRERGGGRRGRRAPARRPPGARARPPGRPAPGPLTRRCCPWTSPSAPWTRSPASGCRTSCCASRRSWARRSCSSPTTSTRRSSWGTGSGGRGGGPG